MKKIFEPLKIEIYYYEEQDVVRTSPQPGDFDRGEHETDIIKPAEWYN